MLISSFTHSVVKVAWLFMESLEYIYKAHVGVKESIWHSQDLIKLLSMAWLTGSGDWHNAVTSPPAPDIIFTAFAITSCAVIIVFLQLLELLLGYSSQVHKNPLPSNWSYAGQEAQPQKTRFSRVFGILPHLGNIHSSEGTRDFNLLGQSLTSTFFH